MSGHDSENQETREAGVWADMSFAAIDRTMQRMREIAENGGEGLGFYETQAVLEAAIGAANGIGPGEALEGFLRLARALAARVAENSPSLEKAAEWESRHDIAVDLVRMNATDAYRRAALTSYIGSLSEWEIDALLAHMLNVRVGRFVVAPGDVVVVRTPANVEPEHVEHIGRVVAEALAETKVENLTSLVLPESLQLEHLTPEAMEVAGWVPRERYEAMRVLAARAMPETIRLPDGTILKREILSQPIDKDGEPHRVAQPRQDVVRALAGRSALPADLKGLVVDDQR